MNVYFLTTVFNGHVSLTTIEASNMGNATTSACEFITEQFPTVSMWEAEMKEIKRGEVATIYLAEPLFIASLIKA